MIVIFLRRPGYTLMRPHGDEPDPWWLSAGGLEYLRNFTDYSPYRCEHISEFLIEKLKATGDLRPLAQAPPTGTWVSNIPRESMENLAESPGERK
jgi:hypothetical protein